jgi:hypothetical protein
MCHATYLYARSGPKQSIIILHHEDQDSLSMRHRSRRRLGRRRCAFRSAGIHFARSRHQTDPAIKSTLIVRKDHNVDDDMLEAAAGKTGKAREATGARLRFCSQHQLLKLDLEKRPSAVAFSSPFVGEFHVRAAASSGVLHWRGASAALSSMSR